MLRLHRSERADCLVDALGGLLADPLTDPLVAEVVAVPTRGVERWLTQRLSHRLGAVPGRSDGVCANLDFPFPGVLLSGVMSAATGVAADQDPWHPERCTWTIVDLIDERADDPGLIPLISHLRASTPDAGTGPDGPLRRMAAARHIADLFDRYALHRPDLLLSWLAAGPGAGRDPAAAWQMHLWLLLRERIGSDSPAERLQPAAARLRADPGLVDLPSRLSVFGLTRLPASQLELLDALGAGRQVHLFLLHPSGALWDRASAVPVPTRLPDRADDPTVRLPAHPLLRSWGRDAREMQLVLGSRRIPGGDHHPVPIPRTHPGGLLQTIQSDVRADRIPGAGERVALDPSDTSLCVYSCHGRARQVEVMRDAVLHLLAADPSLEPRDVVVMCPDIDTFAPLIQAAFGLQAAPVGPPGGEGPAGELPAIRVRLADRSLRQTNPLLAVAARLLDLAGSRLTASEVLDLAARPPVSRRFGFDRDELSTIERWVAGTGIRWGLDAAHRRPWHLERLADNTWAAGLDRLMLGVAMADEDCRTFAAAVPLDEVPSTAVDLAGRVTEFVTRLGAAQDRLSRAQPVSAWLVALADATESLAQVAPGEEWQLDEFRRSLAGAAETVPAEEAGPVLGLEEVRALLGARLAGRPTRANFRTGDLTICTLVPMRSVPHRVVALLGLDDGTFPRHPELDGDDLLGTAPRIGDRDARSEDRQLLLDALLAAEDHLIITYSGRDERTNRRRPPCAPVAELLDVIDATACSPTGGRARDAVVVAHPLQPFDRRNFVPGALGRSGPWSFDRVSLGGARAAEAQTAPGMWLPGPLPALSEPVVPLDQLVAFVQHPVRTFLRRRLGLYLTDRDDEVEDGLPLELDPLQKWAVGDRLLDSVVSGLDLDRAVAAERRRGFLPPGAIADSGLSDICADVADLYQVLEAAGLAGGGADSLEVRVDLPGGRTVTGTVPGVRASTVTQCNYSRLGAKHRLAAWVRFLALNADRPDGGFDAVTVGRGTGRNPVSVARLDLLPGSAAERRAWAVDRLAILVDLYDRGMREPLPLCCRTSAAWVAGRRRGEGQDQLQSRAANEWVSGDRFPGEQDDPDHLEVWGRRAPVSVLLAPRPAPDETGPGWPADESTRFGALARRLWDPLLDHEILGDR